MSPLLLTMPTTITAAGNLVAIMIGTLLMSAHSHLLFALFTFWSREMFFSFEKKTSCLLAAGFFGFSASASPSPVSSLLSPGS
jgi:hypothetical protein